MSELLTKSERDALESLALDERDNEEIPGLPAKLSDKILMGLDDDDISMTVSRRTKGKKTSFLFELDEYEDMPSLLTLLRDEYKGGDFVIEGKNAKGQWVFKQGISVEAPITKDPPASNNDNDFLSVITAMNESNRQQQEMMRAQIEESRRQAMQMQLDSARSQNEMLLKMMELNSSSKNEAMGPTEMVSLIGALKEVSGADNNNPMELFLRGMEMGRESANNNDESFVQAALKSIGAPLMELANAPQRQQQQAQHQQTQQPQLQSDKTDDPQMMQQMKIIKEWGPFINMLAKAAAQDADPEVYACMILDQAPAGQIDRVLGVDGNYEKLFKLAPQLKQHRQWFDNCRAIVLDYIKEDSAQAPESEPESESENERDYSNVSEQQHELDFSAQNANENSAEYPSPADS